MIRYFYFILILSTSLYPENTYQTNKVSSMFGDVTVNDIEVISQNITNQAITIDKLVIETNVVQNKITNLINNYDESNNNIKERIKSENNSKKVNQLENELSSNFDSHNKKIEDNKNKLKELRLKLTRYSEENSNMEVNILNLEKKLNHSFIGNKKKFNIVKNKIISLKEKILVNSTRLIFNTQIINQIKNKLDENREDIDNNTKSIRELKLEKYILIDYFSDGEEFFFKNDYTGYGDYHGTEYFNITYGHEIPELFDEPFLFDETKLFLELSRAIGNAKSKRGGEVFWQKQDLYGIGVSTKTSVTEYFNIRFGVQAATIDKKSLEKLFSSNFEYPSIYTFSLSWDWMSGKNFSIEHGYRYIKNIPTQKYEVNSLGEEIFTDKCISEHGFFFRLRFTWGLD